MEYQTILFKKNPVLFKDETEALDALRSMKFTMGEPVIAMYGPSWKEAKLILAIGKRTAAGDSAFDIVATSNTTDAINIDITNLENNLSSHEDTLANGNTPGHVLSGRNINYINGYGYVTQLQHKINFTGNTSGTFDASKDISIEIPSPSNELPLQNQSQALVGTSGKWARADHVHPTQRTITGNAGSATKLESQKTIKIDGAVTGSTTTDFSENTITIQTSVNHTHDLGEITDVQDIWDAINTKAPSDSPELIGIPTAPTADRGTNTSQIATTEFVINEIQDKIEAATALRFRGTLGNEGTVTTLPASHITGDTYVCIEGSPNVNGIPTEPGDIIICTRDSSTASDEDWTALQCNIVGSVQTGQGLTGGGDLKSGITISHQSKPISGNEQGGTASFVTKVSTDSLGHISNVEKSEITGRASAGTGSYLSDVWINGTTIQGSTKELPKITIQNGNVGENEYVTGLSVGTENNSHSIVVTKGSLEIPKLIIQNGPNVQGQYISELSVNNYTITVRRLNFPEESGKVKISEDGIADYLENKLVSGNTVGTHYGVGISENADKLVLDVEISKIDANNGQIIKLKRTNISGEINEDLEEGELFINTGDSYIYIKDGDNIKRLYQNATGDSDGLLSATDKKRLDAISASVGNIGDVSSSLDDLEQNFDDKINNLLNITNDLSSKLSEEISNRYDGDVTINKSIQDLNNNVIKSIKLASFDYLYPTAGNITLPIVSNTLPGLMPSDLYNKLSNLPDNFNTIINNVNNYKINGYRISDNPILNSTDIKLENYSANSNNTEISNGDTVNVAIGKLQYQINKEKEDRTNAINSIQSSVNSSIEYLDESILEIKKDLNQEINDRSNSVDSLRNEINNNITTQLNELRNEIDNNINVKIEEIQDQLSGDGLTTELDGTHYLGDSTNIIDALKALDNKMYEIEQAMLSSELVKSAD